MTNQLLILPYGREHYYSLQNKGILVRRKDSNHLWSPSESVIADATGPFCVYGDSPQMIHLIFVDSDNNLSYATRQKDRWKTYKLSKLNPEIHPEYFRIYPVCGRLNLLYSVRYSGEILLIHCILGNHAKPHTVDKLDSPHFWIYNSKAYYTNNQGACGYVDLHDEKPDTFCKLYDDARNISLYNMDGKEFTLFTRDNKLYVNNNEIIYDTRMELPAVTCSQGILYVMWKSGGYVRYITSKNQGNTWTSPMRYMTSGAEITQYFSEILGNSHLFYGYNTSCDLHLFSRPDIFR